MVHRPGLIKRGFTVQKHIKVIPRTVSEQLGSPTREKKKEKKKQQRAKGKKEKKKKNLIGPAVQSLSE